MLKLFAFLLPLGSIGYSQELELQLYYDTLDAWYQESGSYQDPDSILPQQFINEFNRLVEEAVRLKIGHPDTEESQLVQGVTLPVPNSRY